MAVRVIYMLRNPPGLIYKKKGTARIHAETCHLSGII